MPTSTVQDYLKAIYTLTIKASEAKRDRVGLGKLAERVGVTPGTVTSMMRHLSESGLVDYEPRRGVRLTDEGQAEALRVLRRHRLVELFLVQVMAMDWAEVHREAEALEHVISDALLERMDVMLGRPVRDPHGDPIPTAEGLMPDQTAKPLSEQEPGHYRLVQIMGHDAGFLGWLEEQGLTPGAAVRLVSHDPYSQTSQIEAAGSGQERAIGTSAAERLLVNPIKP